MALPETVNDLLSTGLNTAQLIDASLLNSILTLVVIHFIATVSPGPEFMLISKEALTKGRKAGFISLAGTLSGLGIHILYSALGLAAVLASSPQALLAIQILGGMGLMDELPLERIWRDHRVERIWDGTSEIQRHIISRAMLRPHEA